MPLGGVELPTEEEGEVGEEEEEVGEGADSRHHSVRSGWETRRGGPSFILHTSRGTWGQVGGARVDWHGYT